MCGHVYIVAKCFEMFWTAVGIRRIITRNAFPDAIQTLEHNAGMGVLFRRLVTSNPKTRPTFPRTGNKATFRNTMFLKAVFDKICYTKCGGNCGMLTHFERLWRSSSQGFLTRKALTSAALLREMGWLVNIFCVAVPKDAVLSSNPYKVSHFDFKNLFSRCNFFSAGSFFCRVFWWCASHDFKKHLAPQPPPHVAFRKHCQIVIVGTPSNISGHEILHVGNNRARWFHWHTACTFQVYMTRKQYWQVVCHVSKLLPRRWVQRSLFWNRGDPQCVGRLRQMWNSKLVAFTHYQG